MYRRFKIINVKVDSLKNQLIIETSHEIDPRSIIPQNIRITNKGDCVEEILWRDFHIKNKIIAISLYDQPKNNMEYVVRISDLQSALDDKLETSFNCTIMFESHPSSNIEFLSPALHSLTKHLEIKLLEKGDRISNYYQVQVSTSPVFSQIDYSADLVGYVAQSVEDQSKTVVSLDAIALTYSQSEQIYIRMRTVHIQKEEKGKSTTSPLESIALGDWIETTCTYIPTEAVSMQSVSANTQSQELIYSEALEILSVPLQNVLSENFNFSFDCELLQTVEKVKVYLLDSLGNKQLVITSYTIEANMLCIQFVEKEQMQNNSIYLIVLENIKADDYKTIKKYEYKFYSRLLPNYVEVLDVANYMPVKCSIDTLMTYLAEATELADYYNRIPRTSEMYNNPYYSRLPKAELFEKQQFIKNYVAYKGLTQSRVDVAMQSALAGKLGEIEFTPKGKNPDLTLSLSTYQNEMEKWKRALQGHKDYLPEPTSAKKSIHSRTYKAKGGDF